MMELKNVSRYLPDYMPYGNGVQYFKCERGQDFYESLDLFSKKYKLCIEPNTGIIRSIAEDASTLYPVDFSVIEVDELPDGVDILGGWMFDGEKIVPRVFSHDEMLNSAGSEKSRLMQDINAAITPLQDAKDLGIITEAEKLLLLAWKRYRVLLNRIDVSRAPDIEWPEPPVTR